MQLLLTQISTGFVSCLLGAQLQSQISSGYSDYRSRIGRIESFAVETTRGWFLASIIECFHLPYPSDPVAIAWLYCWRRWSCCSQSLSYVKNGRKSGYSPQKNDWQMSVRSFSKQGSWERMGIAIWYLQKWQGLNLSHRFHRVIVVWRTYLDSPKVPGLLICFA